MLAMKRHHLAQGSGGELEGPVLPVEMGLGRAQQTREYHAPHTLPLDELHPKCIKSFPIHVLTCACPQAQETVGERTGASPGLL